MTPASERVIHATGISKQFRRWEERPDSLKTALINLSRGRAPFQRRRHFQVLEDVSFEVRKGEFVGIMGRNGAGKSTLLKILCGIYQPTSGAIEVKGIIAPLIELGAGFHPELSGYENVFLNASILGFGRKVAQDAFPGILEFSELGDFIHMPVKNYSSGMQLRLAFSVATQLTAPILLIDEILAVGDAAFQAKCLKRIQELHASGRTIILITHDPASVEAHCSRCIVIDHHKKVFDGAPAQGVAIYKEAVFAPKPVGQ
jgi:ABC-2 type transport system ATP-binding protein